MLAATYLSGAGPGRLTSVRRHRTWRRIWDLPVSSTKSMHGHALGAAAALECLATVLALRDGVLPPTANFNQCDPECDLDVIPNRARRAEVEYALSNSFAFGGLNAVLALRAPKVH